MKRRTFLSLLASVVPASWLPKRKPRIEDYRIETLPWRGYIAEGAKPVSDNSHCWVHTVCYREGGPLPWERLPATEHKA